MNDIYREFVDTYDAWVRGEANRDKVTVARQALKEQQASTIESLQAERDRYREAFESLCAEIIRECSQENADGEPWDTFQDIALRARQALKEQYR